MQGKETSKSASSHKLATACPIYQQFNDYLDHRAQELEQLGGKDSPVYARERALALQVIHQYRLSNVIVSESTPTPTTPAPETEPSAKSTTEVSPTPEPPNNNLAELRQLMEMYREGLLTAEEFKAAKGKFLGL